MNFPQGGELELQQRALTSQLAGGLASEYKINRIPYSRRFPAACCREFQLRPQLYSMPLRIEDVKRTRTPYGFDWTGFYADLM